MNRERRFLEFCRQYYLDMCSCHGGHENAFKVMQLLDETNKYAFIVGYWTDRVADDHWASVEFALTIKRAKGVEWLHKYGLTNEGLLAWIEGMPSEFSSQPPAPVQAPIPKFVQIHDYEDLMK